MREPYERYSVSDQWEIKFWNNAPRKLEKLTDGRVIFTVRNLITKKNKKHSLGRTVFCVFNNLSYTDKRQVYHINWNSKDNRLENLGLWFHKKVAENRKANGRDFIGAPNAKVTFQQAEEIRERYKIAKEEKTKPFSYKILWEQYGVSRSAVQSIVLNRSRTKDFSS